LIFAVLECGLGASIVIQIVAIHASDASVSIFSIIVAKVDVLSFTKEGRGLVIVTHAFLARLLIADIFITVCNRTCLRVTRVVIEIVVRQACVASVCASNVAFAVGHSSQ
jgi:hypothetical protein